MFQILILQLCAHFLNSAGMFGLQSFNLQISFFGLFDYIDPLRGDGVIDSKDRINDERATFSAGTLGPFFPIVF